MRRPLALAVLVLALFPAAAGRAGPGLQHPPARAVRRDPGDAGEPRDRPDPALRRPDAAARQRHARRTSPRTTSPRTSRPIGASTVEPTTRPGDDLTIRRDSFGVPHIYGKTRAATWCGAGWVTAEDRRAARRPRPPAGLRGRRRRPGPQRLRPRHRRRRLQAQRAGRGVRPRPAAQARPALRREGPPDPAPTSRTTRTASPPTGAARTRRPRPGRWTTASPSPRSSARSSATAAAARSATPTSWPACAGASAPSAAARRSPTSWRPTTRRRPRRSPSASATASPARSPTQGLAARPGRARPTPSGAASVPQRLASNFLVVGAEPLGHGRADGRHGPAAGLLRPRDRHRGRPARPRHQRAGRAHPGRQPVRPDRAHARLRVEPHDRDERQHRRVPRAALRPRAAARADHYVRHGKCVPMRTFDAGTLQNASTGGQPKRSATT